MGELTLKSAQFRKERERTWRDLDELLARVEAGGLGELTAAELNRLPALYRAAASSLGVAVAISLDRNLLDYLTALVGRAYLCVYGGRREVRREVADFFLRRFPRLVRRRLPFVAVAVAFLLLGVVAGYRLTENDPERYYSFVSERVAQGRTPAASPDELRKVLYAGGSGDALSLLASFLFTHNAGVGILSFALGFAAGAPTLYLLFSNGLALGAMAAIYRSRGLALELWAWVLPHGVTELGAVCLCGAGGLIVGWCLVFPGRHTRLQNLAAHGREAAMLVVGAVAMLFVAALLEGFFRQIVRGVELRLAVAAATALFWLGYFAFAGRERRGPGSDPAGAG